MELIGQTALVTGGTRGLGRALAHALAQAGANVAIVGRDATTGMETAEAVRACGRRALVIAADVTDQAQMERAAAEALAAFGRIDILVCNAGVGAPRRPLKDSTAEDFRACFDVNVLGVMLAMRAVLPTMIAQGAGRIVVIGGSYGYKGVANSALYASSKWAIRGLVKSTALEVGASGVTVNTIAPGGVDGDRLRRQFRQSAEAAGETEADVVARFTSGTALGQLGTADDVAASLLYLVGRGGRNITGQDIVVDAGTIV